MSEAALIDTQTEFPRRLSSEAPEARPYKAARADRYRLRRTAGRLLGGRVADCGCKRAHADVQIWRSQADGGRAEFRGLVTCGSIWACPVCAGKIAGGRALEVAALIEAHERAVYADQWRPASSPDRLAACVFMATFTVRHSRWQSAEGLKKAVAASWKRVQQGRAWRTLKARFGIVGTIRALEVTNGASGWHPHLHVLAFTARPLPAEDQAALADALFARWQASVAREGADCLRKAFDFREARGASGAAAYVAKWGAGAEVAKGATKDAASGQRSPWRLLRDYERGDRRAGALFIEYGKAFKGARHLTYSVGLREAYGLREAVEDDDLAAQGELAPEAELCVSLSAQAWADIVERRAIDGGDLAHEILAAAEIGGEAAVLAVLRRENIDPQAERKPFASRPWDPGKVSATARANAAYQAMKASRPDYWGRFSSTVARKHKGGVV
jgi:hypothetical protein